MRCFLPTVRTKTDRKTGNAKNPVSYSTRQECSVMQELCVVRLSPARMTGGMIFPALYGERYVE